MAESFAPLAEEDEVTLEERFTAWPLTINADAARLTQVVQNLLANALRHTSPGGAITLGVSGVDGPVEITVVDDGAAAAQ